MRITNASDFRAWIKQIETNTSLTPSEIARASGLAESTLTRYMHPDYPRIPQRRTIKKIAGRFGGVMLDRSGVEEDSIAFERRLQAEAETLGLDPDAIARQAIENAIKEKRFSEWMDANREVFEAKARDVDEHGLWCDRYRLF
ncbi:MAG: type II toxin-antitoxin system CcdA family antitoxin [Hyphomonadaceae bacterium]|nr:type II toxin-antitoxin system CcdA family antitoxin [Hyphomonadaceae bacterium]